MASTTRRLAAAAPSSSPVRHWQNRALPMSSPWSTPAGRRPYSSSWSSRPSHRVSSTSRTAPPPVAKNTTRSPLSLFARPISLWLSPQVEL
uniref:Uncharacterized protein n=1 Tax=Oryza barthii TaxID=65489 RepID=A0A0D3HL74_9ORYZ